MDKALQVQFDKLEASKRAMLHDLASWKADQMARKPLPDAWSAAQVLDHIAKVEGGILQTVAVNLRAPHAIRRADRIGNFVVRCVMRSRVRVKVPPEALQVVPADIVTADAALLAWDTARAGWLDMLKRVPLAVIKQGVFSHPRGGWMDLPDTVTFLRLHHEHHRQQFHRIERMLASNAAPASGRA